MGWQSRRSVVLFANEKISKLKQVNQTKIIGKSILFSNRLGSVKD
jgi:hypothetical protein